MTSKADWLLDLSEQERARGDHARAEHLALLAWLAYDGQPVDLDGIVEAGENTAAISRQAA